MMPLVVKLDAAIKYREEDLNNARILVEQFESDDPDTEVNLACLDYKVILIRFISLISFVSVSFKFGNTSGND
jgi:hypothetical protein